MKVAMCQMLVECAAPRANLDRACRSIRSAEADVAVLPECLDIGWTHPAARQLAQPIPGLHSDALATAAREHGIYVVAGLVERDGARLYNAAVLIGPSGEILLKHRKINELDIALDLYSTGTRLEVAVTPLGRIGVNICADNFPETLFLGESLACMGASVILSPCAWAVDATHDNAREPYGGLWVGAYTALAKKHGIAVVGVSNVGRLTAGPWAGRKCIGCSLAVGPGGEILAQGPYGESAETILLVDTGGADQTTSAAS